MKKLLFALLITGTGAFAATNDVELQQAAEIIGLLRTHYVDGQQLDPQQLTDASITGLLKLLGDGAELLTAEQAKKKNTAPIPAVTTPGPLLARAEIIDPDIGYLRLAEVETATVAALDAELSKFTASRVTGFILDLRFATGTNYSVAAAIAGRFLRDNSEVFAIQRAGAPKEPFRAGSPVPTNSPLASAPLMLLINQETRDAAEAIAGALRAQDRGIAIGFPTAGDALTWKDLPLSDGRVLRVATAKIAISKGNLFPNGLTPDIPVRMDRKIEEDLVLHFATNITLTASLTDEQTHKMMTEADLVKYHRGESFNLPNRSASTNENILTDISNNNGGKKTSVARDVVLQRAVDILKGIRVLLPPQ